MKRVLLVVFAGALAASWAGATAPQRKTASIPAPPDVAVPPEDAQITTTGLATKVIEKGSGTVHPDPWDRVTAHYTGWTTDGKMFDSSVVRGRPSTFSLGRVIPGWTEGLPLMVVGEKRRLWIPENLAYSGRPGRPQGMLVFDVELIGIIDQPAPPAPEPAPEDVAAPPEDAIFTESGLAYKVLRPGYGDRHPAADSGVSVEYTGWTTDGKMFDTSRREPKPARFLLNRVVPGFSEGIRLMVEGQRIRLWIPEDLAYGGAKGAPAGMLVFDVELITIAQS